MDYCLAVFRSRSQALTFKSILESYQVPSTLIPTPRQISVSCGLCVKFHGRFLAQAKEVLNRRKFDTFVGFFWQNIKNSRQKTQYVVS